MQCSSNTAGSSKQFTVNVNKCSSNQLLSIPGVDRLVADGILKFRRQKGSVKRLEELWHLPGMSRSKMQILRRHVFISEANSHDNDNGNSNNNPSEKNESDIHKKKASTSSPVLEMPHPRLPLTKSMIDLICPRQKLAENRAKGVYNENILDPTKRSLLKLDPCPRHSLPSYKKNIRRVEYGSNRLKTGAKEKDAIAASNKITLCPSPSGNNISLSCVINRNLLSQLNQPVDLAIEGVTARKTCDKHSTEMMHQLERQLEDLVVQRSLSFESVEHHKCPATTSQMTSSGRFSMSSTDNPPLTAEKLLVYDLCHRMTQEEKMISISAWVDEVNLKSTKRCQTTSNVSGYKTTEIVFKDPNMCKSATTFQAALNLGIPILETKQRKKISPREKTPQAPSPKRPTLPRNIMSSMGYNVANVTFKSGVSTRTASCPWLRSTNTTPNTLKPSTSLKRCPKSPQQGISPFLLSRGKIMNAPPMQFETAYRCGSPMKERAKSNMSRQRDRTTVYSPI